MKYGLEKRASAASLLSLLVAALLSNGCGQEEEQTTISKELAGTKGVSKLRARLRKRPKKVIKSFIQDL